jgi:hypothetical protein
MRGVVISGGVNAVVIHTGQRRADQFAVGKVIFVVHKLDRRLNQGVFHRVALLLHTLRVGYNFVRDLKFKYEGVKFQLTYHTHNSMTMILSCQYRSIYYV